MPAQYHIDFNKKGEGWVVNEYAGETLGNHKLVYRNAAGTWSLADADAVATMPVLGITMGAIPDGRKGEILLWGYIGDNDWTWTQGDEIFASTTAGELTQVMPTGIGDVIQVIAMPMDDGTMIHFMGTVGAAYGGSNTLEGETAFIGFDSSKNHYVNYFLCDGVADNVEWQQAVDYVNALNGGTIYVEAGAYYWGAGTVTLNDTQHLEIIGARYVYVYQTTSNDVFVLSGASSYIHLENLTILSDSARAYNGYAIRIDCDAAVNDVLWESELESISIFDMKNAIIVQRANVLQINNLQIQNCGDSANTIASLHMPNPTSLYNQIVWIRNLLIEESDYYPIYAENATNELVIDNFWIEYGDADEPAYSIYLASPTRAKIRNGTIIGGTTYAIYARGIECLLENIRIQNTTGGGIIFPNSAYARTGQAKRIFCENTGGYGIYANIDKIEITDCQIGGAGNDGIRLTDADDCLVSDNYIFASTGSGIGLIDSDNNRLLSNYIDDESRDGQGGATMDYGIALGGSSAYNIVDDNQIHNAALHGVLITSTASYNEVTNNVIADSTTYGVDVSAAACVGNVVQQNKFDTSGTAHLYDIGTDTAVHELQIYVKDPDTILGTHPTIIMPDEADTTLYDQIQLPLEFQELETAVVIIVSAATGNLRRSFASNWGKICADEAYNSGTDSLAATEVAVTANELECIDIAPGLTGVAAGDLIGYSFTRQGSHANDTINDDVYYLGGRVRYV